MTAEPTSSPGWLSFGRISRAVFSFAYPRVQLACRGIVTRKRVSASAYLAYI
jgi:hypothetical protein